MIPVPPGASSVTCPVCNTWHSIEVEDAGAEDFIPPSMGYSTPGIDLADAPPASLPDYEPHHNPALEDTAARFIANEGNDRAEAATPGYLINLDDGSRFALKKGVNTIGRKDCDILLQDRTVSRRHCIIEANLKSEGPGWDYIIYDFGHVEGTASANGVLVAGRSLPLRTYERIPIGKGTVIELGNVRLKLHC
jgi:LSD1 subclass zinc finger protein